MAPTSPAVHHRVVTVSTSFAVTKRALLAETCGFEQQSLLCLMASKADSLVGGFLLVLGLADAGCNVQVTSRQERP